jgi:UDP-glucose 4-epimerase
MNDKNILVTGGAGFCGSNLIKHIQSKYPSATITVLDNLFTGVIKNVPDDVLFINGDTCDIETYFKNDEISFDIVFHFGEYSRIVSSFDDIDYVLKTNLHGTTRVLEMCRKWGSKLIYSASSSKFGNDGEDENLSPYSWMKSKIVELIKNYKKWYNLEYEICYFFNVYGPGQITSGDYATVVGIFERQCSNNEDLTVVSPGTQSRDFTHIDDIVRGVIASVEKNLNGEWHLRSGTTHTIIEVAKMFDTSYTFIPERRGERIDAVKIETDTNDKLDWEPKHSLSQYINDKNKVTWQTLTKNST